MRRISTGAEQLLTDDRIADAVVSYAAALARAGTAGTITIPIVDAHGQVDRARLLLGPTSQLTDVPDSDTDIDLPDADAVVAELTERTEHLEPTAGPHDDDDDDRTNEPATAFPDFGKYE